MRGVCLKGGRDPCPRLASFFSILFFFTIRFAPPLCASRQDREHYPARPALGQGGIYIDGREQNINGSLRIIASTSGEEHFLP
ncbi:hypothetical protein K437DRAFT_192440 [Tilletiaria anomala UBC 951]|uniref:Uncharacterized protein n=1 Tax=Tilletiaria anomala (strain ATCC 24038 / CBS 436.72 / UBC 951) TaxID=1037660 RepID=A0A066VE39_TILAU|nr:uncharacterized protein K437DRAFT_192440 [Tilletiaria anomala UBC 951]KDN40007.1 hypothetical protein K437DRAFT_192440 [Tilletiaria anomala UBC 951]